MLKKSNLINKLVEELDRNNLAIFAGAGLSVGAGYVDWKELLRGIAEEIGLDVEKEHDLISLAQYYTNEKRSRFGINQIILEEFSQQAYLTENHKILARLPIDTFWTTNYDSMIEKCLIDSGKEVDVKHNINQIPNSRRKRDAVVYKMHGDSTDPVNAVLIKDDYEKFNIERGDFFTALQGDLLTKRFLFLGLSFSDPNIDFILSRIRITYKDNRPEHYCILKKIQKIDNENLADFEYRQRKQELFIGDLKRVGIQTLLIQEYSEITEILREVEKVQKQKTIFISGAAQDYSPFNQIDVERFVSELTQDILKMGYRVVTGFGLGIGSSVISGAVEYLLKKRKKVDENHLILRPFPQDNKGKQLYTVYRQDMISYSGISIFLFGNKYQDGELVLSDGIQEEFDISNKNGNILLPVGGTGYMARQLWQSLSDGNNNESSKFLSKLSPEIKDLDVLKSNILDILKGIKK